MEYYSLDPAHTDPKRIKSEREKARKLKKSQWWQTLLNQGVCHYCHKTPEELTPEKLTMDHVVPIARGGSSTRGNIVPACVSCNQSKKLDTPVDQILNDWRKEE